MITETIKHKGLTIKIIQDEDAPNPRKEYSNAGTMVCWHSRYDLGDEQRRDDPREWMEELAEEYRPGLNDWLENGLYTRTVTADYSQNKPYKEQMSKYRQRRREIVQKLLDQYYIMLPLALIDHSGISMYIGSGAHACDPGGWDSGQVGWIYCTKKKAVEEWGKKTCTRTVIAAAEKYLKGEVEEYDQYLTGDVYGYIVEDEEGVQLDSCWGMFGFDYCKGEAIEEADRQLVGLAEEAAESAGDIPMVARA